mgnify:CR=1 FL=1
MKASKSKFCSNSRKMLYTGIVLLFCVLIEVFFHFVLKMDIVYTHLFYVPIILAAYWWGLKGGLITSILLGLTHLLPNLLSSNHFSSSSFFASLSRCLILILVGVFVGIISGDRAKFERELLKSKKELEAGSKALERKVKEKTRNLSILFKVSKVASSTLNLKIILKKVLNVFMLIGNAKSGVVLLVNPKTAPFCWEVKSCSNFDCPAFKLINQRCWEIPEVHCCEDALNNIGSKLKVCVNCDVFQEAELVPYASRGLSENMLEAFSTKIKDSLCRLAIIDRKPMVLQRYQKKSNKRNHKANIEGEGFFGVPLMTKEQLVGILCLFGVEQRVYNKEEIGLVSTAAEQVAVAIKNAQLYSSAEEVALTDDLTRLHNYRSFQAKLAEEIERARRSNHPLSMSIVDIDGFKQYNDNFGHIAGNKVLKEFAALLQNEVRVYDIVARYGGDEFCIIFPETDKEEALETAERIRFSIEKYKFPLEDIIPGGLTISTGLAAYPSNAKSMEELVLQADKALYRAKNAGRNLIRTAEPLNTDDLLQSK